MAFPGNLWFCTALLLKHFGFTILSFLFWDAAVIYIFPGMAWKHDPNKTKYELTMADCISSHMTFEALVQAMGWKDQLTFSFMDTKSYPRRIASSPLWEERWFSVVYLSPGSVENLEAWASDFCMQTLQNPDFLAAAHGSPRSSGD